MEMQVKEEGSSYFDPTTIFDRLNLLLPLVGRVQTSYRIIGFRDVLCRIFEDAPFEMLRSFGATCTAGHQVSRDVLRLRLSRLLTNYVDNQLAIFSRIFARSGAVISGSCPLWMLLMPSEWTPNNLNIVVPIRKSILLRDFFEGLGYTAQDEPVDPQQRGTICKFKRFTRGSSVVSISESSSESVFPPILASYTTFGLNIMTMDSIACLYPALTLINAGFSCYGMLPSIEAVRWAKDRQLGIYPHSVPWVGRCGYSCPAIRRRVHALEGSVVFNWRRGGEVLNRDNIRMLAADSHYAWVINATCQNPFCEWRW
jgi:hypothetical protein